MRNAPDIVLAIDQLGVSGLSQSESFRLQLALTRELETRLESAAVSMNHTDPKSPLDLGNLRLQLTNAAAPETMGLQIATQIVDAITPAGASGSQNGVQTGGTRS